MNNSKTPPFGYPMTSDNLTSLQDDPRVGSYVAVTTDGTQYKRDLQKSMVDALAGHVHNSSMSAVDNLNRMKSPLVNSINDVMLLVKHKIITRKQALKIIFPRLSDKEVEEMASQMVDEIILGDDNGKKED